MLIIDQMDALTMQNWDHVKVCLLPYYYPFRTLRRSQFVMSHMNGFPKESRDTDFSRIKPWYLDGQWVETHLVRNWSCSLFPTSAIHLRQSILLSAYETAETRSLYNSSLKNVAGKIRTEKHWQPIAVPDGIDQVGLTVSWRGTNANSSVFQNFVHFDCVNPVDEPEKRFHHFTTQVCPRLPSHITYLLKETDHPAPPRRLEICCTKRQYHRFRAVVFWFYSRT